MPSPVAELLIKVKEGLTCGFCRARLDRLRHRLNNAETAGNTEQVYALARYVYKSLDLMERGFHLCEVEDTPKPTGGDPTPT